MTHQPNRILPVLYGSMIMTSLAIFPVLNFINVFCCAGIALGGFAGAYFYSKQLTGTEVTMTSKDGVMIGILSGILSAVVVTGFTALAAVLSETNPITEMMAMLDQSGVSLPAEMLEQAEKFNNEFNRYGYSPTIAIFSFVIHMILFPLFGAIGAMIGVSVLNKKRSTSVM